MQSLIHDLRYGVRMLRKRPGFSLVAISTLALGIGVNAALFSVFNAFVLKPLPLKDPDKLVSFEGTTAQGERRRLFSYRDYLDYREQTHALSNVVAWNKVRVTLGDAPPTQDDVEFAQGYEYLFGQIVSGNYFAALGADMSQGRAFAPSDDEHPDQSPLVVLSNSCWERRFASDPQIVGKTIVLQGQAFTVIGVTARGFIGTTPDAPSFWVPLTMRDRLIQAGGWAYKTWFTDRNTEAFTLLGTLAPGVTQAQAAAETQLVTGRLAQSYPSENRIANLKLESAGTFVTLNEDIKLLVMPLLAGFGLVLLIACANVANLFLARAAAGQREIAVRLALGASRRRLVRQLVIESLMLSLAGGVAGLLLATWTLSALYPIVLSMIPLPDGLAEGMSLNLAPDWRVFGFTFLVAAIGGVGAGLAPALQASNPELSQTLKGEGSTFGRRLSQSRLRSALVVAQIAVCMALLIAAGLLVRNLQRVRTLDTGMSTASVFSVTSSLSRASGEKKDNQREADLQRQLAERLRTMPGVASVSTAYRQPLSGGMENTTMALPGQSVDHPFEVRFNFVSAEYFKTFAIRLTGGRTFTAQEADMNAPVVVISEATAARFWPNSNPIGKSVNLAADASRHEIDAPNSGAATYRSYEVVGVARDTRSRWIWEKDETFFYVPVAEKNSSPAQYLLVRTNGEPGNVMSAVRGMALAINPLLRTSVRRIDETLPLQMAPFRAVAWLSGVLGLLALGLASIGLYGVMAFVVTQRTREIGIRVALGARPQQVVKVFLIQGLKLTAVGVICGSVIGLAITRLLAALLIDISALDPLAFISVTVLLALVALLATFIPARRATKVDPLVALRYE
jgi:predicted permease